MKQENSRKILSWLVLIGAMVASCQSTPTHRNAAKFHEAKAANVVLRFSTWDCIFVAHPELRQDGFLRILRRADVSEVLRSLPMGRDLAVVIVPASYRDESLASVVAEWKALLSETGFQRVVLVRSGIEQQIQGLEIIDDSAQPNSKGSLARF